MKPDQINISALAVVGDLQQIDHAGESLHFRRRLAIHRKTSGPAPPPRRVTDAHNRRVVKQIMHRSLRLTLLCAMAFTASAAGPIRLLPRNPHYFEFRGKAVALVTSGEHYGSVINQDFDYRRYLATLAADGLNYTRLFGGSYIEIPARSFGIRRNNLAPEAGRFIAPWAKEGGKFNLERWNPRTSSAIASSSPKPRSSASWSR